MSKVRTMDIERVPGMDAYDIVIAEYDPETNEILYLTDIGWQPTTSEPGGFPNLPNGIPRIPGLDMRFESLKIIKAIGEALGLGPS